MKNYKLLLSVLLVAALFLGTAFAAGGDAGDPLVSQDYLNNIFSPLAEKAAQEKLDALGKTAYDAAETRWRAAVSAAETSLGAERTAAWSEARLKQGDIVSGLTGTQFMLLTGSAAAQLTEGVLVDVTDGSELISGNALKTRHRYIAAEDTAAAVTVTSRTAVIDYCGDYHIAASADTPDYYAMADALCSLTLFRGTGSGIAQGFELEVQPTRIQALIMLLRLLGEESAALACTADVPFQDVVDWAKPYVAYAYEKGYTNGVSPKHFSPDTTASVGMYVEFVLRALGYSDITHTDVSTALDRAQAAGVVTAGEKVMLQSNDFLRSDVVYLSWYALETMLPNSTQTLHQKLESVGLFTPSTYQDTQRRVTSSRL